MEWLGNVGGAGEERGRKGNERGRNGEIKWKKRM